MRDRSSITSFLHATLHTSFLSMFVKTRSPNKLQVRLPRDPPPPHFSDQKAIDGDKHSIKITFEIVLTFIDLIIVGKYKVIISNFSLVKPLSLSAC